MKSKRPVIGILGAGKLGMVLAQLAIRSGYQVYMASSKDPETIKLSVDIIAPGAVAVDSSEAIKRADIVILALPLSKYQNISATELAGKLVVDAMNHWWEVDGDMSELADFPSSSEMVQFYLTKSRVVKALSHMGYHNLLDDSRPAGADDRRVIAIAGNNDSDTKLVSQLINDLGFDPVIIGDLAAGKYLEPGRPMFGASATISEVRTMLPHHLDLELVE